MKNVDIYIGLYYISIFLELIKKKDILYLATYFYIVANEKVGTKEK